MRTREEASAEEHERATGAKWLPPLSQSRYEDLACETLYAAKHIAQLPDADSEAAQRGTTIHEIVAAYVNHLVRTKQKTDYAFLDVVADNASPEVLTVLEKIRESYQFDPGDVLETEMHLVLDENFRPTTDPDRVEYEGTLDLVLLPTMIEAEIHDWKSYFQIIDATTFQSKFYPLLLMCAIPSIERVKFVLEFVRYGATREVTYTRADLPSLKRLAIAANDRRKAIHASTAPRSASPGRHCMWCPLLPAIPTEGRKGCPLAMTNPYATMTPEERVSFAVWLREAQKQNEKVLKNMMVERGTIRAQDGNGAVYAAEFVAQACKSYPLAETGSALVDWLNLHPNDAGFAEHLTVSGLHSPLKAKKREELKARLDEVAVTQLVTKLRVGKLGEKDEDENVFEG